MLSFSALCSGQIQCFAVCTFNTAKVECRKLGQVSTVNQDDDHESCLLQLLGTFQPLLHHSLTQLRLINIIITVVINSSSSVID